MMKLDGTKGVAVKDKRNIYKVEYDVSWETKHQDCMTLWKN